jgi:phosphoribosyl 1,2-cyclic phosphodiesterase
MKLKFLGTRGEIDARTRRHKMHSSLAVSYRGHSIMLDCGTDWLRRLPSLRPEAIVLTHAHPDHAWGLRNGAPCRVYATEVTWQGLESFPIREKTVIPPRSPFDIFEITLEAFPVEHSTRAPAVGYRIQAGRSTVFYVPDLVFIYDQHEALKRVNLYIGDGATLRRPLVRRRGSSLVGHAAIRTQLGWCQKEGVVKAFFTHCGSEIVQQPSRATTAVVSELGFEKGVNAQIAFDGLALLLP